MKRLCQRSLAVTIALAVCSGCATTGTAPGSSTADTTQTKAEGTALGALVGAALGAGVGALAGGKDGAVKGALIGLAAGGVGGYVLGSTVAQRKQKYAKDEDRLDGEIKVVEQYNTEFENYNAQAQARVKALDQECSDLRSRYKAGIIRVADLEKKQNEIKLSLSQGEQIKNRMEREEIALREYANSIKQTQPQAKVEKLEQEVATLRENIAMLDTSNKQMARMADSLTVRR